MTPRLVIAIDGPAASGKGTLARKLARYLGYRYLDTGLLYRGVGLKLLKAGQNPENTTAAANAAQNLSEDDLNASGLRTEDVGRAASIVSAIPEVRSALLKYQRDVAAAGAAVLDGRDIGTVVCPEAHIKLFITASIEARAKRRYLELQKQDKSVTYESVLADLSERDERDSRRAIAPLKPAADAIIIDTSEMDADIVFEEVSKSVAKIFTDEMSA